MWDLRIPSGVFFIIVGVLLCIAGAVPVGMPAPLTETNVNLYTGMSFVVFGGVLLWLAKRKR